MNVMLKIALVTIVIGCTNDKSGNNSEIPNDKNIINVSSNIKANDTSKIKNGLIKEEGGLKEVYYYNGKKNGIFKSYYKINGKLETLGFYENDKPIGTWYYFNQNSQIIMIEERRGENKDKSVKRDDGVMIRPPFMSYLREYDPKSGLLKSEGMALYFEDVEIDYFKYGQWKKY